MNWDRLQQIMMGVSGLAFLPAIFVVAPILVVRALRRPIAKKFEKVYRGLVIEASAGPGLVSFRIHTYDGFRAWFTQTTHQGFARPDDAKAFLGRVLRYNLSRGLLAYGGLLVPLVALPEFILQRRSVVRQAQNISADQWCEATVAAMINSADERVEGLGAQAGELSWSATIAWLVATVQSSLLLTAMATSVLIGQGIDAGAIPGAVAMIVLWVLAFDLTWR